MGHLTEVDDYNLVKSVVSGNKGDFAELVRRYKNKVYSTALRMTKSKEDAEDIAQDVFLKVYSGLPSFRAESNFSTYLYRITMNTSIDYLRKKTIKPNPSSLYVDSEDGEYAIELEDTSPSPLAALEEKEKIIFLRKAIENLPDNHKQMIILRDINELSYDEIGEIMNLSEETVKSRINRARARLKKDIEESGNISLLE